MAPNQLRWLVLKEIADNALDAGAAVGFAFVDEDPDRYFIEDDGPGLHGTPQDIAELRNCLRAAFARGPTGARAPKCWPRRGRLSTVRPLQRMR